MNTDFVGTRPDKDRERLLKYALDLLKTYQRSLYPHGQPTPEIARAIIAIEEGLHKQPTPLPYDHEGIVVGWLIRWGLLSPEQRSWAEALLRSNPEDFRRFILRPPLQKPEKSTSSDGPTRYDYIRCEFCGFHKPCFSVLCSQKNQGHYVTGNKLICKDCLEKGEKA